MTRTEQVKEKAVDLASDLAGTVVDPRTGVKEWKAKATSPMIKAAGFGLAVGFVLGYRRGRRRASR